MTQKHAGEIERLCSVTETAALLGGLSVWTVRKWIFDGRIKSNKLGSRRLVPLSEIKRLIEESGQVTASKNTKAQKSGHRLAATV